VIALFVGSVIALVVSLADTPRYRFTVSPPGEVSSPVARAGAGWRLRERHTWWAAASARSRQGQVERTTIFIRCRS
jgi:hypothetical protein